ncbi:MAG: hypothetical protein JJE09_06220 [Bacteroidia bacterium]|nr:hypothetical protein [Bacteroidia bacterium]
MKQIKKIFMALLLMTPSLGFSQDEQEVVVPDPNARKKIEAARIALISERMGLTVQQAEKFWPVYHEFSGKQSELRQQLKDARGQIDPNNTDPKKDQEIINLGLQLKQRGLDLEKDYSGRMLQVISAQQMLNMRNAEREFNRMVLNQLQQRRTNQQRKENFRDKNQQLRQKRN